MNIVFKALADPSRRKMLDALKSDPGMTVNGLTERFEFSRYAVMKHLRVLEKAGLVVHERVGKEKRLFLNTVPLQQVHDRWMSQYTETWSSTLIELKKKSEN